MIAGTDDEGLNEDIYSVCKCLGILVNVISDRTKCDFHFPGIVKRDTLVAGVNAGGRDHGRAKTRQAGDRKSTRRFYRRTNNYGSTGKNFVLAAGRANSR